jgi:hypothetical protein
MLVNQVILAENGVVELLYLLPCKSFLSQMGMYLICRQPSYLPAVTAWAHTSMGCGYGHIRNEAGYCQPADWYPASAGCYETTIIKSKPLSILDWVGGGAHSVDPAPVQNCHPMVETRMFSFFL